MSLDGFISGPSETGFEHLFAWHGNGEVEFRSALPQVTFRVSKASADHVRAYFEIGAIVCGRRLFDITSGWGGSHPLGAPVFVVTHHVPTDWSHPEAPFTFVTDGVESAVRQAGEVAGDQPVVVTAGDIGRQALEAGLVDEIHVELVPVLLGGGTRYFEQLGAAPIELGDPEVTQGVGVTHLRYRVRGRT
jgi:dihydrofolate reductase